MSALCKLSSTTNERAAEEQRKRDERVLCECTPLRQRGISVGRVAMRRRGGGKGRGEEGRRRGGGGKWRVRDKEDKNKMKRKKYKRRGGTEKA